VFGYSSLLLFFIAGLWWLCFFVLMGYVETNFVIGRGCFEGALLLFNDSYLSLGDLLFRLRLIFRSFAPDFFVSGASYLCRILIYIGFE
jgi:hypothetical protein